jgi:hypothetical protein
VPSVSEAAATGEIAEIYSDIRNTLGTSVVNLIWRNLATMPGALQWTWSAVRLLYIGAAAPYAGAVRRALDLPKVPPLSADVLTAAGIGQTEVKDVRAVLDSYHSTNALALLSALIEHYDPSPTLAVQPSETASPAALTELPPLPPMASLPSEVQRLIGELN